jgi:hypothetical protein
MIGIGQLGGRKTDLSSDALIFAIGAQQAQIEQDGERR